jgi:hypothetical protein
VALLRLPGEYQSDQADAGIGVVERSGTVVGLKPTKDFTMGPAATELTKATGRVAAHDTPANPNSSGRGRRHYQRIGFFIWHLRRTGPQQGTARRIPRLWEGWSRCYEAREQEALVIDNGGIGGIRRMFGEDA